MTVLVFQRLGMMPVSTDSWNRRRWPEMLLGPEVFLVLVLLNWPVTSSSEMMIFPGEGEGMVVRSYVHSDIKSLLSK